MTDARFPERWLNDRRIIRLTDSAFRTFVLGMTWAVANRSDGYVSSDDLDLVHGAKAADADELVKASLWSRADDAGYWIEDFTKVQTSAAQLDGLEHRKAQDRARAKKYREKSRGTEPDPDPSSSRDGSRDSSRDDIGQARTGQAGQDRRFEQEEVVTSAVTRNGTSLSSPEPCFSCGGEIRNYTGQGECDHCLTETRVSSGADRIAPDSPPDRSATAHRAPVVRPSCAYNSCSESPRPGKQMCPLHFTYEPSSTAA